MTVALLALNINDCRYALTKEPPHLFCAGARRENSSYCNHHHRIAYPNSAGRAFSSGGFLADHTETVAPSRPARAHEVARAIPVPVTPPLLNQFVRAAAACRHDAAPAPKPRPLIRTVAAKPYQAPISSDAAHEAREQAYLADLAQQCERVAFDIDIRSARGFKYAIELRNRIAAMLDMSIDELLCRRRAKDLVQSRQLAMFCIVKGALRLSLPYIGARVFGGFDHSTVIHGRDRIATMIADGTLPARLAAILDSICAFDAIIADAVRKLRAGPISVA